VNDATAATALAVDLRYNPLMRPRAETHEAVRAAYRERRARGVAAAWLPASFGSSAEWAEVARAETESAALARLAELATDRRMQVLLECRRSRPDLVDIFAVAAFSLD
jgi:hypothetical protein